MLTNTGYEVSMATVDASSTEGVRGPRSVRYGSGDVTGLIQAAGVSPSQASPATLPKVDLYGTELVFHAFGSVISPSVGALIVSQSVVGYPRPPSNKTFAACDTTCGHDGRSSGF
jgi:hypothetical protein